MKAFWNYYQVVSLVNVCFSLLAAIFSVNLIWFPIMFGTIGIAVGMLAFTTFYKTQYYFYYNLGYTKTKLALMTFSVNLVACILMLLLIILFS